MSATGAFFDIDGTLVGAPSLEWRLALRLALRGELSPRASAGWAASLVSGAISIRSGAIRIRALDVNKRWLAGVQCAALHDSTRAIARQVAARETVASRLRNHAACGHQIFFVSGTLAPLARAFAEILSAGARINVCATELEVSGGKFTGQVMGAAVCGPEKAEAVRRIAAEHEIDLSRSFAYANSIQDFWFLETAGHPIAVAPDQELAEAARRNGWEVLREKTIRPGDPFLTAKRDGVQFGALEL